MKNLVKISFIASLLFASSINAHERAFVGVEGGYEFFNQGPALGAKGGYSFGDFRVYGAYDYTRFEEKDYSNNKISTEVKATTRNLYIGLDTTPEIADNLKAVFGSYMGYGQSKAKVQGFVNNKSLVGLVNSESLWLVGTKLGLEYIVADHHGIETGLKYDLIKIYDQNGDHAKFRMVKQYLGYSFYF
ncbi:outer membrane beta-barrel protein [Campylobacter sp. FMV-PI01]|uniref:Outer membrane beta-barrel protein n=1 Tax=Campylobacter portucalensis TaxID=2608384 RepID=A0A6L5WFZ3_9BACT|nr:outer membrane beta-barrel protein [Campylobacter portucalensis]MSN95636.1 outer membrane beta-barrel protein [Campylobacter portucalensis]